MPFCPSSRRCCCLTPTILSLPTRPLQRRPSPVEHQPKLEIEMSSLQAKQASELPRPSEVEVEMTWKCWSRMRNASCRVEELARLEDPKVAQHKHRCLPYLYCVHNIDDEVQEVDVVCNRREGDRFIFEAGANSGCAVTSKA